MKEGLIFFFVVFGTSASIVGFALGLVQGAGNRDCPYSSIIDFFPPKALACELTRRRW